jgi:hypothetical protein
MRPKIVITLLLLAFLVIGTALFLKQHVSKPQPVDDTAAATVAPELTNQNVRPPAQPPVVVAAKSPVAPVPAAAPETNDVERLQNIGQRVEQLQDWSRNDDAASLANILNDLTNSEKEIRVAAVEAVKQFGSRDAIPALKAAAANAEDPHEKVALLDAADFLALPSLSELRAQKQSAAPADAGQNPP